MARGHAQHNDLQFAFVPGSRALEDHTALGRSPGVKDDTYFARPQFEFARHGALAIAADTDLALAVVAADAKTISDDARAAAPAAWT